MMRTHAWMPIVCLALASACEQPAQPKVAPDASQLTAATDVFWSLQKLGFIVAKQKPKESQHGCQPFEYLAQATGQVAPQPDGGAPAPTGARFRISVFACPSVEKAREITENPNTRHVDSLLRDHHEGGVLRRQALQIIIRMEQGAPADADRLLESLGGL